MVKLIIFFEIIVKLISFTKISLLIVVSGVIKLNEIQ